MSRSQTASPRFRAQWRVADRYLEVEISIEEGVDVLLATPVVRDHSGMPVRRRQERSEDAVFLVVRLPCSQAEPSTLPADSAELPRGSAFVARPHDTDRRAHDVEPAVRERKQAGVAHLKVDL
jgi:hypothetical protein